MPWGLLILLAAGLLLLWAGVVVYTAWLLTHPPRRTYAWAVSRGLPGDPGEMTPPMSFTAWTCRSGGVDLPAWTIEGKRADGPVIVITHGWADSRIVMLERAAALVEVARQVVVWELPGHGEAGGACTLGARESVHLRAVVEAVRGDARVVLYGFSLGAGVSIVAAAELGASRLSGVIAEAPYRIPATPARNVLRLRGLPYRSTLGPALLLARSKAGRDLAPGVFDRVAWAARMPKSVPLLVLHGDADAVCPLDDARAIASAAPAGRLVVVAGGDHQGLWSTPSTREACVAAVREFVDSLSPTPGAASEAEPATRSS